MLEMRKSICASHTRKARRKVEKLMRNCPTLQVVLESFVPPRVSPPLAVISESLARSSAPTRSMVATATKRDYLSAHGGKIVGLISATEDRKTLVDSRQSNSSIGGRLEKPQHLLEGKVMYLPILQCIV